MISKYKVISSLLLLFFTASCQSQKDMKLLEVSAQETIQPEEKIQIQSKQSLSDIISKPTEIPIVIVSKGDLWQRIRNGLTMQHIDNPRIQAELAWYLNHPNYMLRVAKRAEPYLFHIVDQIESKKLPMELALLPIVESAYDPFAYSQSRASGIWQFIPSTGREMGLVQNWWYDGRRDISASTEAALKYLSKLTAALDNDWLLGLAAYNSGQRRVKTAIKYNEKLGAEVDFWSLHLPKETRSYVPKLVAIAKIIANPKDYEIDLPVLPNKPYFNSVKTAGQIDLAQAAEMAEIDIETIYLLNPAFNRWATSPQGKHELLLPIASIDKFLVALSLLKDSERIKWVRYKIKLGDTLSSIAKKYDSDVQVIGKANRLNDTMIRAGAILFIPTAFAPLSTYSLSSDQRLARKQSRKVGTRSDYIVKTGDSFWSIAQNLKVTITQLAVWNGLSTLDTIQPGQKLAFWQNKTKSELTVNLPKRKIRYKRIKYPVKNGDSLERISKKFNVSIDSIITLNRLDRNRYIQPGQLLILHVNISGRQ